MSKPPKRNPGDTFNKGGKLYRVSSTGKPFRSSNSAKANQQRALNARLNQPIASIPGMNLASPTTERDLAHEAQAATNVRYGPQEAALGQQLGQAQQQVRNANDWYNQYRNNLQNVYQPQVAAYQQGTIDAMKAFQGGITGLGQQDQQFVQGQQAAMPQGTAPVGASVAQNANAALGQRQALVGNFGTGLAGIGAANNTFASNLANVVAPAQQATAVAQKQGGVNKVLQARTDLQGQKGAYNQQYRSTRKADETKNLLAAGALGINTQNANTKAASAAATAANNSPSAKAQNAQNSADARVAANHGYTLKQWRMLGPDKRAAIIAHDKKTSAGGKSLDTVITSGPYKGHTQRELQAMTLAQRQALVDKGNNTGLTFAAPATQDKKTTQINSIVSFIQSKPKWKSKDPKVNGKPMTVPEIIHHYQAGGTPKDVLEVVQSLLANNGKLGPGGVAAAHRLGIKIGGRWSLVGNTPKSTTNYAGGGAAGSGTT